MAAMRWGDLLAMQKKQFKKPRKLPQKELENGYIFANFSLLYTLILITSRMLRTLRSAFS
jgi:hypothetical protein